MSEIDGRCDHRFSDGSRCPCPYEHKFKSRETLSVVPSAHRSESDPIDVNLTAERLGLTRHQLPPEPQG